VNSGEMPIEISNSWFSAKAILVVGIFYKYGGKALINLLA